MAEVVLFHSVLGIRPGVTELAERLRSAGHTVHVADLYEGHPPFDSYEPAMEFQEEIGFKELSRRAEAAVAGLSSELVYCGFSMGCAAAEMLAAKRPGARGAVLVAGANALKWFGVESWPAGVPAEVHYATDDEYREPEELDAFGDAVEAAGASFRLYDYPVKAHLFSDPGLPSEYDREAAELMYSRILEFVGRV